MMTDKELQQLLAVNAKKIQSMFEQQATQGVENEEQMNEFRLTMLQLLRVEEELINLIVENRRRSSDDFEEIDVDGE